MLCGNAGEDDVWKGGDMTNLCFVRLAATVPPTQEEGEGWAADAIAAATASCRTCFYGRTNSRENPPVAGVVSIAGNRGVSAGLRTS